MAPSPIESRHDLAGASRGMTISVLVGLAFPLFALRTHAAAPVRNKPSADTSPSP